MRGGYSGSGFGSSAAGPTPRQQTGRNSSLPDPPAPRPPPTPLPNVTDATTPPPPSTPAAERPPATYVTLVPSVPFPNTRAGMRCGFRAGQNGSHQPARTSSTPHASSHKISLTSGLPCSAARLPLFPFPLKAEPHRCALQPRSQGSTLNDATDSQISSGRP